MKKALGCMTRVFIVLVMLGIIGAIAVSYLGGDEGSPKDVAIRGVIVIASGDYWEETSEGCAGAGSLATIKPGSTVTVAGVDDSDSAATTEITAGNAFNDGSCSLIFDVDAADADTYLMTIGEGITATCGADVFEDINGKKVVDIVVTPDGAECRNARE